MMKKELSKYQRKNMTVEEIKEHEKDVDADGYELILTEDYGGYTIDTRKRLDDSGAVEWKVWNDFDDREDFAQEAEQLTRIIEELHDEIDIDESWEEEDDD